MIRNDHIARAMEASDYAPEYIRHTVERTPKPEPMPATKEPRDWTALRFTAPIVSLSFFMLAFAVVTP